MEPLFLTMDFGTQSVRVGLFNKKGEEVAMEKEKYNPPYFSTLPNYAEQNPDVYFESFAKAAKRLKEKHGEDFSRVVGAGLSCFRDSSVLLDKDRKVVRPVILWLDQRMADCRKPLPLLSRIAFKIVGMKNTVIFNRKRSMANWIKENEPENWEKVDKFIAISTYITYLLTGNLVDCASNYGGHYPINFKKRQWYKNPMKHLKGQIFGIEKRMLCDLVKEGSVLGTISKEASEKTGLPEGLKLYACGSDKSCETLGLGVLNDRVAAISYGTASTVETTRKRYTESEPFLPGYASCLAEYYNMDIQVYRGYWMINWFINEFGGKANGVGVTDVSADVFDKKLSQVPPGCDGLVLQPYWGPSLSRPLAKGAIIGFSDSITQEHFYRAIIEGIAYALREGLEHFEKKIKHGIYNLRISGGGSSSEEICQITADIFDRPVQKVQTSETSSLGAAIAGFLACEEFKTPEEAVEAMVHPGKVFTPNKEISEKYHYLYKHAYLELYPRLKGIYSNIKRFNVNEEKERWKKQK